MIDNRVSPDRRDLPGYHIRENIRLYGVKAENFIIHPAGDRAFWDAIPSDIRDALIKRAEPYLGRVWTVKRISDYLDYFKPGERPRVPTPEEPDALVALTIAEALENRGRFLPDIINTIFAICETSTWAVPAHFHSCGDFPNVDADGTDPVPDRHTPIVDLYAGTTAKALTFAAATLRDALDTTSPRIIRRVTDEVRERLLDPILTRDNLWYLGFMTDTSIWSINNWLPTMINDALFSTLALGDEEYAEKMLFRAAESLDIYVDHQSPDGFCDEGACYWFGAGGALLSALFLADSATGAAGNVFSLPRIAEITRYPLYAHIEKNRFIAYSDATALNSPAAAYSLYAYGKRLGIPDICRVAREILGDGMPLPAAVNPENCMYYIRYRDECAALPVSAVPDICHFYPAGEALFTRKNGMYLFAIFGHNHESHNHNDVGAYHFEIDNCPVAVDPGDDAYTKNLFDLRYRYTIWFTRSKNHCVPLPGGKEQPGGAEYRAENVRFTDENENIIYAADITAAYPAGTKPIHREMCFSADGLTVTDTVGEATVFPVITPYIPEEKPDGNILLGPARLNISGAVYDGYEEIPEQGDTSLTHCYGKLYRVLFRSESAGKVVFAYRRK